MEKTLYVHIGTGKTGTSAIQNISENDRFALYDIYGVYYFAFGHKYSNSSINRKNEHQVRKITENLNELKNIISNSKLKKFVLSSENFPSEKKEEIEYIKKLLKDVCNIKIIVYLRRQDTYTWSWFAEKFKTDNINANIKDTIKEIYQSNLLNYEKLLENWKNAFGQQNILVNVYPTTENILIDFYKNIDVDIDLLDFEKLPRQNTSLQAEQVLLVQKMLPAIVGEKNEKILVEEIRKPFDIKFNYTKSLLSPERRRKIINDFEKYNNKVANLYLNKKVLFEDDTIKDEETWCYPIIFQNGYIDEVLKSDKVSSELKNLIKNKLLA